jgi:hypothetical protein
MRMTRARGSVVACLLWIVPCVALAQAPDRADAGAESAEAVDGEATPSERAATPGAPDASEAPADELQPTERADGAHEIEPSETEAPDHDGASDDEGSDHDEADENDREGPSAALAPAHYVLERVEIRGNAHTDGGVIRSHVPLRDGEVLDVEDPRVESIRWRLLATGWFDDVRLRLRRGSERGYVVLVVDVTERNTLTVQGLTLGFAEGVLQSSDPNTQLNPYFGITLSELSLFGTGVGVDATALLSFPQQGVRLRGGVASLRGSGWGLNGMLFFNNGREFFGNDDVLVAIDECPAESMMPCTEGHNAVVLYRRYGGSVGTGTDLATTLRFTLDYHLEAVEVVDRPAAASHMRGTEDVPINFSIHDGVSWISALEIGLVDDERDDAGMPSQGRYAFVRADLSSMLIGSSYDFVRVQAGWREWFRLPEAHHTLRLGLFLGGAVGDVPFFYKFYVSDLSDLIPSRVLELNLDRRGPSNLLGTSIREMRAQELAARVDIEYALWLYESNGGLRGLQIYGLVGLYALADAKDLQLAIPGYSGFARVPIDLTFDVGLRFDTVVGVFQLGFSNLLGFISL